MNRPKRILARGLLAVAISLPLAASPAARQDHGQIRDAAETHASSLAASFASGDATVRVTAARLDSRLNLPQCDASLESFSVPGQQGLPSSVGVRCTGTSPWSLYVPVSVEVITEVVVIAVPGMRGERLTAEKLRLEPRDVARMTQGYLTDLASTEEMVLRRQLLAGTVLSPAHVERERIIRRGERVELKAGGGTLAVSVEAEALADAARGDRLRVRNVSSGRIVEGIVEASGLVRMNH